VTAETFRYLVIGAGFLVLGFNIAIIIHAREIVRAVTPWRVFIVGKSGLTVFVIVTLYQQLHTSMSLLLVLAGVAMAVTLVSLAMLERAYRLGHGRERRSTMMVPDRRRR
jgi:hypothetical protein